MKFKLLATLALVFALGRPAVVRAQGLHLTTVSVAIGPGGVVTYAFTGDVWGPNYPAPDFLFTGTVTYDSQQKRATEHLTATSTGFFVSTSATCPDDPWRKEVTCTGGLTTRSGFSPGNNEIIKLSAPRRRGPRRSRGTWSRETPRGSPTKGLARPRP